MIHAIHKGQDRVTSTADGDVAAPYKVIGYGGGLHNYGKVMYPQKPAADCSACHVEGATLPKMPRCSMLIKVILLVLRVTQR
jgi:hypothetical protein